MAEAPAFFVPEVAPGKHEEAFEGLAKFFGCDVPPLERRIYSITFVHDGEEWTATVGESMRGIRLRATRSRGKKVETKQPLSDPTVVMAIFASVGQFPHKVVTSGGPSKWANPFFARAKSATRFSASATSNTREDPQP